MGRTLLRCTLACRFGGGAGVTCFISARASSGEAAATGAAAGTTAAKTDGAGGGTMVGTEVSNSILSGHLRADWMRSIMLLAGLVGISAEAEASLTGAGSALGHTQPTMKIIASNTLPTQRKYRTTGTACPSPRTTA